MCAHGENISQNNFFSPSKMFDFSLASFKGGGTEILKAAKNYFNI